MNEQRTAPYGSWKSPVTTEMIVAGTIGLGEIIVDGDHIYWIESRPSEGGRYVIMRKENGEPTQVTPSGFNVRNSVHEYGGGAFIVHGGIIYFSNFSDGRIYRQAPGEAPAPLTAEAPMRYADLIVDARRNRLICVREDHTTSDLRPANSLVTIDLATGTVREITSGADFYASPRLNRDGDHLVWLAWDLPRMPWEGTELWMAAVREDGALLPAAKVAGGTDESIFQPEWSPDGLLYFVADRTGWWNLYRLRNSQIEPLRSMEAEFGMPQWVFRMSTYTFISPESIICAVTLNGRMHLATIDTITGDYARIDTPYTDLRSINTWRGKVIAEAGSPDTLWAIVSLDPDTGDVEELRRSSSIDIDSGYISIPRAIEYPTEGNATAHAFFYPPVNSEFRGPEGEVPPLMVISHGGPTGSTTTVLEPKVQYWTSRGIAVLDVNYGGSTGYGRAYRERLNGNWGIVDVDDCVNGALYLAETGEVDRDRLIIRGGSAGGYTALAALTFRDVFRAGASYYGVSDLEVLLQDSHKFESEYNVNLIGPYPGMRDIYYERSPIHFIDRLSCPIILFQGLEDRVVPPNQAEMMFEAMKAHGIPVAYLPFEGEQHGFRRAENIRRTLDAELYFYSRIFGFEPADPIEPIIIENLPAVHADS